MYIFTYMYIRYDSYTYAEDTLNMPTFNSFFLKIFDLLLHS